MSLRQNIKDSISAAIARNAQPQIPRNNIGLVPPVSSGRSRQLVQNDGKSLTPAGKFYFDQIGIEFSPLNVDQPEIRRRRTKYMKMLDGREKAIARFDNVSLEWKLTRLGKQVYAP